MRRRELPVVESGEPHVFEPFELALAIFFVAGFVVVWAWLLAGA